MAHAVKLKILQWNILFKEKAENVLELLQDVDADIVCLQELTIGNSLLSVDNMPEFLAEQLGMEVYYNPIPNPYDQSVIKTFCNGILSKQPIVGERHQWVQEPAYGGKTLDDQYRDYVEVTVDVAGKKLIVGTTHLSYSKFFKIHDRRRQEVEKLLKAVEANKQNFILTGDFNAPFDSVIVQPLLKHFKHAGPDISQPTFANQPYQHEEVSVPDLTERIDFVFATPGVKVISSEIIKTKYSDHLPILVTVEV